MTPTSVEVWSEPCSVRSTFGFVTVWIPLKDAIIKSMSDEKNVLGEGMSKKGYNFVGMKDYVIRIYKQCFRKEDLEENIF